jgi:dihydromethanopterin reductase
MSYVRAMCAIGQRGQLGLRGRLPWEGERGPEYRADVERFWELTRGHVIVMGPRTRASVSDFAYRGRMFVEIRSSMTPAEVLARFAGRVVFVGGGPPIWSAYAPFIRHWDITRLPYDGRPIAGSTRHGSSAAPRHHAANPENGGVTTLAHLVH